MSFSCSLEDSSKISSEPLTFSPTDPEKVKEAYSEDQSAFYIVLDDDQFIKASPASVETYFDPKKPTVIFVHGWRINNRSNGRTLYFTNDILEENFANIWRRKGWNFIAYHWIQYADESDFYGVECKIWSDTCDNKNIQWLDSSGNRFEHSKKESLAAKAHREFVDSFGVKIDPDKELRIVGHSIGTQLTMSLQDKLFQSNIKVDRIALTDIASSNGGRNYLENRWIGEEMRALAGRYEERGGALETYRCWQVGSTPALDRNLKFDNQFLSIQRTMSYIPAINPLNQNKRHRQCYISYFWSIDGKKSDSLTDFRMASESTEWIRRLKGKNMLQKNDEGAGTASPFDDSYIEND